MVAIITPQDVWNVQSTDSQIANNSCLLIKQCFYDPFSKRLTLGTYVRSEDLVQETFLKGLRHRYFERYNPDLSTPETYLAKIMRNQFIDMVRKTGLDNRIQGRPLLEEFAQKDPAQVENLHIGRLCKTLSRPQREIIYLIYERRLTIGQASETLQEPTGTIKSRLHKALKRIREYLEGHPKF